jgi:serine/threonine protein kinase
MGDKVFLGRYRVFAGEFKPAVQLTGDSLSYQAEEIDSGKRVAVELASIGSLKSEELEQLETEAIAAGKLNHVNIPHLYDFGVEDDHLVYVTEDFEGTLAEDWVNSCGPMPAGPVLRIASQVLSALSAALFHQIVHPAINPRNLMLVTGQTAEGEWPLVKVLHFLGDAPKMSGSDIAVAEFDKSLHYVSREQINKGTVDFRSEIYSLGCTMWFLLTGAPPLLGKEGTLPLASPGATGKVKDIPRKVRRLLAQVLSPNPETRPRDPIEFYRKLQECLVQVERRERISQRFGLPFFFRAPATDVPAFRRSPLKALASAALFLAMAALTALVVHGYIRHRRIVRAEQPIGVPVGVPDAVAVTTPATAGPASSTASNPTQETGALAQSNRPPSEAAEKTEAAKTNALSLATNSIESADKNQITNAPHPATPDSSPNPQEQPPALVAANSGGAAATESTDPASAQVAATPPPVNSPDTVAQETPTREIVMHEVRPAESAEPEVRRAEPVPPGEGPGSPASETNAPAKPPRNAAAQLEENRDSEKKTAQVKRADSESKIKSRTRSQKPAKPTRRFDERIYLPEPIPEYAKRPPSPGRSVRARFVGITPDGWWMMQLPSNEIVVVPPPPRRDR